MGFNLSKKYIERFWSYVEKSPGCWTWKAGSIKDGYGSFWCGKNYGNLLAHRISWVISGRDLPPGKVLRHQCDNPPCVKPDHLEVDTHAGNVADKVRKNRQARGEQNGRAKLKETDAREILIRHRLGETNAALSREYKVTSKAIRLLVQRRTWRHLSE